MLFRPGAEDRLHSIQAQLLSWGEDADRYRLAAIAARRGESQLDTPLSGADELHDGLMTLLEELDGAVEGLPNGHAEFGGLQRAQRKTLALLESVGNSLDVHSGYGTTNRTDAVHIA